MVYGPQKGGTADVLVQLDRGMGHLADIIARDLDCAVAGLSGSGAAGGLGGGVVAFLHGTLKRGIDIVLEALRFENYLKDTDVILTGEGRLDEQTRHGKVMKGVTDRAERARVPVLAVVGSLVGSRTQGTMTAGLTDIETLVDRDTSVDDAMRRGHSLLTERTARLFKRHLRP